MRGGAVVPLVALILLIPVGVLVVLKGGKLAIAVKGVFTSNFLGGLPYSKRV